MFRTDTIGLSVIPDDRSYPPPSDFLPVPFVLAALVIVHGVVLLAIGRDWTGGCIGLWQWDMRPKCNSSHLGDPYSIMHGGFGLALGLLFQTLRPSWRVKDILLLVVFSSTIWEVIENLPPVIEMFGYEGQPKLSYHGDSIVNSLGDTMVTTFGGTTAFFLSRWVALAVILIIELVMSVWIGDGYVLGLMQILAG